MDLLEFERRASELMSNLVVIGEDGAATLSPNFDRLQKDIEDALREFGDAAELHALANVMDAMKASVADPEIAWSVSGSPAAFEPQPKIFDAIEDGDTDAAREALRSWDVNQTHGRYESTALYRAMSCASGASLELMGLLLDAGADPNKGLAGTNVLHGLGFANLDGIEPADLAHIIRRCMLLGADLEQRSKRLEWTPLIAAVSEWNPIATEALLLAGANIRARAGEVEGVAYSGAGCMVFAQGHEPTIAVLERFASKR